MSATQTSPASPVGTPGDAMVVPLVIRGEVHLDHLVQHQFRHDGASFFAPDVSRYVDDLLLAGPAALNDLHELPFDEVLQYLAELGPRLRLDDNPYLQQAFQLSRLASELPDSILEHVYRSLPEMFEPDRIRDVADRNIGIDYLERWVPTQLHDGTSYSVRAFGARSVHVISGNLPIPGASTVIRVAITRSDAIIKTPSNDPGTAAAVARTMCELDPDHPITRHIAVAYWKGGDATIEDRIYSPRALDKIVAWGGMSSMRHIRGYLQPGLDLVALDPKLSATFIGRDALASAEGIRDVGRRLAADIGILNQEGCVNARVIYVETGTGNDGLGVLRQLGAATYEALLALPPAVSTPAKRFDPELRSSLESLSLAGEWFELIGGDDGEGAIILSLSDEPVDFASSLSCRVANLVPVETLDVAIRSVSADTQTVGVFPASLKGVLRDRMSLHGVQRIVTLGHATDFNMSTPQDGMEPLRRMVKWVVDEDEAPSGQERFKLP